MDNPKQTPSCLEPINTMIVRELLSGRRDLAVPSAIDVFSLTAAKPWRPGEHCTVYRLEDGIAVRRIGMSSSGRQVFSADSIEAR
jgi:hypothetical protein